MNIRGVRIDDTFAEAFPMRAARLIITAKSERWVRNCALKLTGFATSVIGCKCEAGIERLLTPDETPDARPGCAVLLMTMKKEELPKRLTERVGQTVLTCPTASCFDGLPDAPDRIPVGDWVRYYGDGFQSSKVIGGRRYWRVPVMEDEFLVEANVGMIKAIGGGNFLIFAENTDAALEAAEAAIDAMEALPGVIMPFPGGIVRSGSKLGSRRYKSLIASTSDAVCPTLRAVTATQLPQGVNCVLEIVIDGIDATAISNAMWAGIDAACRPGVIEISAGNYGGKLGPHHFPLREIMSGGPA
ncbi:MAG: formylmethanofuran--tetrahydromethanopterin N-formyltransferase [Planctomycetaceae bacterium]|nr:formylmethanofuran--tetrahydromethanopterin N-formyltransferase [Planctomycetaceae bacterium]